MSTSFQLSPVFENLFVSILRTSEGDEQFKNVATNLLEQTIIRLNSRVLSSNQISPEHIVLIRQISRWSGKNIFIGEIHKNFTNKLSLSSMHVNDVGELECDFFRPNWISNESWGTVSSMDEVPVYSKPEEQIIAEPWLQLLNLEFWNSAAQKEACWTVLRASEGSTSLIALPTGAGKSLCFQLLSVASSGLTIVIVPTTALAIDQYISSKKLLDEKFPSVNPMYYVADDPNLTTETVRREVHNGNCRLLFTSPEAFVSGSLKKIIFELANQGQLSNLVIDEAHIIESWGRHFRVDFQFLSAVRQQLLEVTSMRLRTFLFSATFTDETILNLKRMFSEEGKWEQFTSQRLRPEIRYYTGAFNDLQNRQTALLDALNHLPRPLIVYVTKKDDCEGLLNFLRANGFTSIASFHGDTDKAERRKILLNWKQDKTDIIIATSAFGMGVDKQNVRTVIHACFPESIDRFYQEVGRGGRDGFSSLSLWMPCVPSDREIALGVRPKVLTDEEKIEKRWKALLSEAERDTKRSRLKLRMDTKRHDFIGRQTGSEDRNWNKSLVLMFVPIGVFKLVNVTRVSAENAQNDSDEYDLVEVEYYDSPTSPRFLDNLDVHIKQVKKQSLLDFELLDKLLNADIKVCRALRQVYGSNTIKVCAGSICGNCRQDPFDVRFVPELYFEKKEFSNVEHEILSLPISVHSKLYIPKFDEILLYSLDRGIEVIIVPTSLMERAFKVISEEMPQDMNKIYRIENENDLGNFVHKTGHQVIWFHDQGFKRKMTQENLSAKVTHVLPSDVDLLDDHGRPFFTHSDIQFFSDVEVWKGSF